jgi:hypothetical protein
MTSDNPRIRGMVKHIECEMCKEFEIVEHLIFECVVSRLLWEDVYEVFNIHVTDFEFDASKWLCNKKFLHFNLVSSAVLSGLWINRNNLVFNKVVWMNINRSDDWCFCS